MHALALPVDIGRMNFERCCFGFDRSQQPQPKESENRVPFALGLDKFNAFVCRVGVEVLAEAPTKPAVNKV